MASKAEMGSYERFLRLRSNLNVTEIALWQVERSLFGKVSFHGTRDCFPTRRASLGLEQSGVLPRVRLLHVVQPLDGLLKVSITVDAKVSERVEVVKVTHPAPFLALAF